MEDFNAPLNRWQNKLEKSTLEKIKEICSIWLTHFIIDVCRTLNTTTAEHIFFWSTRSTLCELDYLAWGI